MKNSIAIGLVVIPWKIHEFTRRTCTGPQIIIHRTYLVVPYHKVSIQPPFWTEDGINIED